MTEPHQPQVQSIVPYDAAHRDVALEVALRSWEPVFERMREFVPAFVYENFYPNGWRERQRDDLARVLDEESDRVLVALVGDEVAGWVAWRIHSEDSMGEVYVVTVAPEFQRRGLGRSLVECVHERVAAAGMSMVMVETGGDPGHAPARAAYEAAGYERWPVSRYFKRLG